MAVLLRQDVPGLTAEQFEAQFAPLFEQLQVFPGFLASACGPRPDGYQITEVWESQEAHERWLREVIAPILRRVGLEQLPPGAYLPLDHFITR